VRTIRMPFTGHEVMPPRVLARALDMLLDPAHPDPDGLSSCRAGIDAELADKLVQADQLIASGKRAEAGDLLKAIDSKFGGLAAPRSLALDAMAAGAP